MFCRMLAYALPTSEVLGSADQCVLVLQEVFDDPDAAKAKGQMARHDIVARYSNEAVAARILRRLQHIEALLASSSVPKTPPIGLQYQW